VYNSNNQTLLKFPPPLKISLHSVPGTPLSIQGMTLPNKSHIFQSFIHEYLKLQPVLEMEQNTTVCHTISLQGSMKSFHYLSADPKPSSHLTLP